LSHILSFPNFHENSSVTFRIILPTDRPTDRAINVTCLVQGTSIYYNKLTRNTEAAHASSAETAVHSLSMWDTTCRKAGALVAS